MFDLITGKATHIPHARVAPIFASAAAQMAVIGLLTVIPLLFVADDLPAVAKMMAFVAPAPPPPAPPPPAPAPAGRAVGRSVPTRGGAAAPVEAPSRIEPEPEFIGGEGEEGEEGVPGGIEGGIPSGVVGGIVGGFEIPPPPPPPAPRVPVRIGGQLQPPALVRRVEPIYPELAVRANLEGIVILEALVNEEGRVQSVKVVRSVGVLGRAAVEAVRQWEYEPLTLNGIPTPFILTVTLSFRLTR